MMREGIAGTARQAELSRAERLVLWGMRTWVAALRADIPADGLHQPSCPCLSEDECLLLDLVALVQAGRTGTARLRAAGLLLPTAGRTVAGAVGPFAELLACSGLRLRSSQTVPAAWEAWNAADAAPRVLH